MPLTLQAKLLRVLQERELERVGSRRKTDVPVMHQPQLGRRGSKKAHCGVLLRVNVFPLAIPALRQRKGDIVPLAHHFLKNVPTHKRRSAPGLSRRLLRI